jgi:septum formation protein
MLESPDMVSKTGEGVQLFLASNSARRRELLSLCGRDYSLLASQVDETPLPNEDGMDYVQRLAKSKVMASASRVGLDGVLIAADTSVIDRQVDGKTRILGKPTGHDDAVEMLRCLRSRTHQVHTALAILSTQDGTFWSDLCTTNVTMRNYNDDELMDYVASGDPMDKAGAYAIQHAGFHPVERLDGCFTNVMGLPLCHLTRSLRHLGISERVDIPQACHSATGYACPVYHQILIEKT